MKTAFVIIIGLIYFSGKHELYIDEEVTPYPYVTSSEFGYVYFKMIPDTTEDLFKHKGFGRAYRTSIHQQDEYLWNTEGWYAFNTFISSQGEYLIRIGNWPRGHKPKAEDLAIAFYKHGKLLKKYSTEELIKDKSKVQHSVSHYDFLGEKPECLDYCTDSFRLVTVDRLEYIFDIKNGEILSTSLID